MASENQENIFVTYISICAAEKSTFVTYITHKGLAFFMYRKISAKQLVKNEHLKRNLVKRDD